MVSLAVCNDELMTIGASFFRDQKDVVYINVLINPFASESNIENDSVQKLYEKLFVGCVYEHEDDKPVFFIPPHSEM